MNTIQIQIRGGKASLDENDLAIFRQARVKRLHPGWYTVVYNGVRLDASTVVSAKRNPGGKIQEK